MSQSKEVLRARETYEAKLRMVARFHPDIEPPMGIDAQPVSNIQWVDPATVQANDYNPNFVAPPEFKLLKVSLLTDGWTQPIVVREVLASTGPGSEEFDHYEVVDGFHRWLIGHDPDVFAMTKAVPVAVIRKRSDEDQMMSTIRHNRARGSHHVLGMADIVATLDGNGVPIPIIAEHLQMEEEEIERLLDRGDMLKRGSADDFGKGWVPE